MEKKIPVRFRWPIKQIGPAQVEVNISFLDEAGQPLVSINEDQADKLHLSEAEYDAAQDAALDAVIRSIMVIK